LDADTGVKFERRLTDPGEDQYERQYRSRVLAVFTMTHSYSAQDSLYRVGRAAIEAVPELENISIARSVSTTRTESSPPRMSPMGKSRARLADSSNGKSIPRRSLSIEDLGAIWSRLFGQVAIAVRDIAGPVLREIPWICRPIAFWAPFSPRPISSAIRGRQMVPQTRWLCGRAPNSRRRAQERLPRD